MGRCDQDKLCLWLRLNHPRSTSEVSSMLTTSMQVADVTQNLSFTIQTANPRCVAHLKKNASGVVRECCFFLCVSFRGFFYSVSSYANAIKVSKRAHFAKATQHVHCQSLHCGSGTSELSCQGFQASSWKMVTGL